ncbi:hypothetical protein AAFF_G00321010 [Aldrovandia affinis]|uniref:Pyrin domain-containing protein n=1 Tax=Aldrovandia affinis TaxID=143900 RepID=A0AAD7R721_9TELE|nr:hypothetical protein AAFF_G00321010 [Aldrovandia affinis]
MDIASELISTLEELEKKELKRFKFYLSQKNLLEGFPHIPKSQLEEKDRTDIVEKMVETYGKQRALEMTLHILRKMTLNDLAETLEATCRQSKDISVYCV